MVCQASPQSIYSYFLHKFGLRSSDIYLYLSCIMSTATKPQGKNQEIKKRNIEIINNLKQTLGKPTIVEAQRTLKIL